MESMSSQGKLCGSIVVLFLCSFFSFVGMGCNALYFFYFRPSYFLHLYQVLLSVFHYLLSLQ